MSMFFPGSGKLRSLAPPKKTKEELDEHYKNVELEKGDLPAMIIAAFITFLPILIVVMAVVYGLVWLLFLR